MWQDTKAEMCKKGKEGSSDKDTAAEKTVSDEEDKMEEKKEKRKIGCNNEEVLAVLAHELGHWKLSHNLKNLVIGQVQCIDVVQCYYVFM